MIPKRSKLMLLTAGALAVAAVAGCGGTVIDADKAQAAILAEIEVKTGEQLKSVDCPPDVDVVAGAEFSCTVTAADGTEAVAELRIRNEDADVDFVRLTKP